MNLLRIHFNVQGEEFVLIDYASKGEGSSLNTKLIF